MGVFDGTIFYEIAEQRGCQKTTRFSRGKTVPARLWK
jgi:hypothetical protein